MGEVYRALDPRLEREVAIKLLPREFWNDSDRLRRFEHEARAAAALNHPNILSLHDIGSADGVPYFVCELLTGETLRARLDRGPLPVDQATDFAAQFARGLAAAHERGIVHRDLKPDNLFITTDGRAKILDFGIAKAAPESAEGREHETATGFLATEPGVILGTVPYMSPEQVRGEPVDARSDIFSLGAVLFEMLSGQAAFQAPSAAETTSAILTLDPVSRVAATDAWSSVPPALVQIVRHCLEKDPRQRFQSARDIAFGLEVLSGGVVRTAAAGPKNRRVLALFGAAAVIAAVAIAVWVLRPMSGRGPANEGIAALATLPFTNLSGNAGDEYFADGMTDSIITDLARARRLSVIARGAVFRFKDQAIDPQQAGRELGASHVLHGSVQRAADKVRINVRLVDVATGYNVWAESFEENVNDVFVIQNKIASRIVEALELTLTPGADRRRRPTANQQAYDAYLQGLYYSHKAVKDSLERAIAFFEQATQLDPQFALAHAALGSAYTQRFFYVDADRRWEQQAFLAIEKALALDPDLAEAYLARGQLAWSLPRGFPHERAVRDLQRAIAIKPSLADAHLELGKIYLHIGLLDKAIASNQQVLRLDPGNPTAVGRMGLAYIYMRECQTALKISAGNVQFRTMRAEALACLGRHDEALALSSPTDPAEPTAGGIAAAVLASKGDAKAARAMIERSETKAGNVAGLSHFHHAQYYIGVAYALLGETRQAVAWLKKASLEGLPCYPLFERDPNLDSLRQDPEFVALMQELKTQWDRFRSTL